MRAVRVVYGPVSYVDAAYVRVLGRAVRVLFTDRCPPDHGSSLLLLEAARA